MGDEFYLSVWPQLEGRTFGEALLMFEDAVPLGVKSAGKPATAVRLNPPDDYVFGEGGRGKRLFIEILTTRLSLRPCT